MPWARVSAGAVAADAAARGGSDGAGARVPRPRGSHLGKSGWRPGRCAGPSSHWGGCWPSPAGSTAWLGRPGRAEARGQDGSGSRGPGHQRARARHRGTRARGEQSPSLRFRKEVRAPGRGRGEDTGHPLGGPSHPRPALAPAQARPAGGGRGGAGVRWAPVAALVPLGGYPPRAGNGSGADAERTAEPGAGDSSPALCPPGPERTSADLAGGRGSAPRCAQPGSARLGRRETGERAKAGGGDIRPQERESLRKTTNCSECAERRGDTLQPEPPASRRPTNYPPAVPRRPFWKHSRTGPSLANPPLSFSKQSGVARLRALRCLNYIAFPEAHRSTRCPLGPPATASTATSRPPSPPTGGRN